MPYLKNGSWYLSAIDGDGTQRRIRCHASTKTEAKKLKQELRQKYERQRLGLEARPGSHVFATVGELM